MRNSLYFSDDSKLLHLHLEGLEGVAAYLTMAMTCENFVSVLWFQIL